MKNLELFYLEIRSSDPNVVNQQELLPWSDMLPENIRKPQKASGK